MNFLWRTSIVLVKFSLRYCRRKFVIGGRWLSALRPSLLGLYLRTHFAKHLCALSTWSEKRHYFSRLPGGLAVMGLLCPLESLSVRSCAASAALASLEAVCPAFVPASLVESIVELEFLIKRLERKELIWGFKYWARLDNVNSFNCWWIVLFCFCQNSSSVLYRELYYLQF